MYHFGLGYVGLIPSGANPTPVPIGVLTDVSVDFSYDLKELRGQYQVAVDVARGPAKITAKAKNATIMGATFLAALGGATSATGTVVGVLAEPWAIPAVTFLVTVANGATFADDLGVLDLTAGKYLTRVAAGPAAGQYSVNVATGAYTFAAADVSHNVTIAYSYASAATGKTITLLNQPMGASTPFVLACYNVYNGKPLGFRFPAVHVPKLSVAMKAEAYTEQDLEFNIVQDTTSTKVVEIYTGE